MPALVIVGLLSTVAQVVLLRELTVAAFGVELIITLALGAWLFWVAVGALVQRRRTSAPRGAVVTSAWVLLGLSIAPDVAFIRASRVVLGATPGAYLPFGNQLLVVAVATLWPALLSGMAFQLGARRVMSTGRSLAIAYAVESAGALVGGIVATLSLRAGLQTFALAAWCGWGATVAALVGWAIRRPRWRLLVSIGAALLAIAIASEVTRWDARLTRLVHPTAAVSIDTPYARITATRAGNEVWVFENNALAFGSESSDPEVFSTLVLLQHPHPARIVLLGGWLEGLLVHALSHAPQHLDVIELDRRALDVLQPLLLPDMTLLTGRSGEGGLASGAERFAPGRESFPRIPVIRLHLGDARRAITEYRDIDALLIGMPAPNSAQENRFYTREFFAQCAAALAADGILGLRLPASENYWTPAQRERVAAVHGALRSVFPQVRLLPTPTLLVLVAGADLPDHSNLLIDRLSARHLTPKLATPEFVRYVYEGDRRAEAERLVRTATTPPNTDAMPSAFRHALILWSGRFWPGLANSWLATFDPGRVSAAWRVAAFALLAAAICVARARRVRRLAFVTMVGLIGMLLETVVVLHYQVTRGVLFADIGILLTTFMLGLTLGSAVADRAAVGRAWSGAPARRPYRPVARVLIATFALATAAMGAWITSGAAANLLATSVALVISGGYTGALFGWATLPGDHGHLHRPSMLYAADVLGGCLGAIIGGVVLIPFLGLPTTMWICAALAIAAMLLV